MVPVRRASVCALCAFSSLNNFIPIPDAVDDWNRGIPSKRYLENNCPFFIIRNVLQPLHFFLHIAATVPKTAKGDEDIRLVSECLIFGVPEILI